MPFVLVLHPSVPAKNLKEFVEYAKKNKWRINARVLGVDVDTVLVMVEQQQGKCAACGVIPDSDVPTHGLQIDHCHETGKARGLLCGACNKALGHARDDVTRLRALIAYLEDARSCA